MSRTRDAHDVVIVGAGAVGLTAAAGFARAGLDVCIVDALPALPEPPSGPLALRVSALTRASENVLANLGAWSQLNPARYEHFEDMCVWDTGNSAELSFSAAQVGAPWLGTLAENSALVAALAAVLESETSHPVTWRLAHPLEAVHTGPDGVVVRAGGAHIKADLLVGADGANSRVREHLGLDTHTHDYEQSAVVANLRTASGHASTAWQRFLPTGPIALLPLPNGYASIVWSTTPDEASELVNIDTSAFNARVAEAFEHRFGDVVWCGERGRFPLRRIRAESYVAERAVLVGDAAHAIHPLAGQGLNLGFMDAAALIAVVAEASDAGRAFHRRSVLRRYERWRKTQNVLTQNAMDWLRRVFAESATGTALARGVGVRAVNSVLPLTRLLTRHASGLSGDLPPLARPGEAG